MKMNFKKSLVVIIFTVIFHIIYSTITEVTVPYVMSKSEQLNSETTETIKIDNTNSWYRNSLKDKTLINFYDEACKTIAEKRNVISIPIGITEEQISTIIDFIKMDHPEYYWFDGDYIATISNIKVSYITLTYNKLINSTEDINSIINEKINSVAEISSQNKLTKVSSIIECYTIIINELNYNQNADYNQSIYSAINSGETVCFGYSKYFKACLDKMGYDNFIIIGNYRETTDGYNAHSWNAVKISNEWYYFDPTWADSNVDDIYKYFMIEINDEDFLENHTAKYLPIDF